MIYSQNDIVNGSFELIGAIIGWANVYKLTKDKAVKGIYWPLTVFYTVWAGWNIYYYPYLHQPLSTIGGACMLTASAAWVILAFKYKKSSMV